MDIDLTIPDIEGRLKAAGKTVNWLCEQADIDRATWQRWKREVTSPRLDAWKRVLKIVDELPQQPPQAPSENGAAA